MEKRTIVSTLLFCFIVSVFWMPSVFASEMPEARVQYRQSTLNALIAESQKEKDWPERSPNQYSRNRSDHFTLGSGSSFELEPVGPSTGDVVGA